MSCGGWGGGAGQDGGSCKPLASPLPSPALVIHAAKGTWLFGRFLASYKA